MSRTMMKQLKELEAQLTFVDPFKIDVRREVDRQSLFAVGDGKPHHLLVVESQVPFLRWVGERLGSVPTALALLIGNGRSGTSWAGLVAVLSFALANKTDACVYCHPAGAEDTHRLLRTILPAEWIGHDAGEGGSYRLPGRTELRVAAFTRPKTWMTDCPVVMVDGYGGTTEQKLRELMAQATFRVVCGSPPHRDDPRRAWVMQVRDHAKSAGTLFRFRSQQNQSLYDTTGQIDELINVLAPELEQFWQGTGL